MNKLLIIELLRAIIWLCGGIIWTMNGAKTINNVWCWLFAGLCFVAYTDNVIAIYKHISK